MVGMADGHVVRRSNMDYKDKTSIGLFNMFKFAECLCIVYGVTPWNMANMGMYEGTSIGMVLYVCMCSENALKWTRYRLVYLHITYSMLIYPIV